MLTRKQAELLRFIHERLKEAGVPPSFDEMKDALDLRSKSGIHRLITALEERGFIRRLPNRARAIEVIKLPMPGPLELSASEAAGILASENAHRREPGLRLAGSYVNFYIANRGIVMPLLDKKTDRLAANRLKRAFPGRQVVGVPAREILLGGGNIHCITQQVPR